MDNPNQFPSLPPVEALLEKWRKRQDDANAAANNAFDGRDFVAERWHRFEAGCVKRCADELEAAIAAIPSPQTHRCSGCGLQWTHLGGAEVCGDCWRKVQPVLHATIVESAPDQVFQESAERMARKHRKALEQLSDEPVPSPQTWQPIESYHGSECVDVLITVRQSRGQCPVGEAHYEAGHWWWAGTFAGEPNDHPADHEDAVVTHWMPLPDPPVASLRGGPAKE